MSLANEGFIKIGMCRERNFSCGTRQVVMWGQDGAILFIFCTLLLSITGIVQECTDQYIQTQQNLQKLP